MKISDLKDYISKLPSYETDDKNSDYRAYTIAYLVQYGGTAKEEELLEDLGDTFDNFQEGTALRIVKEGVADAKDGIINLLDFDTYSIADKAWILVECGLKNKYEKEVLEESVEIIKYNMIGDNENLVEMTRLGDNEGGAKRIFQQKQEL